MTKITILGAGITGLAIASQLSKKHEVTIVARDFPGDPDSLEWASPWAGATFMGQVGKNTPEPWSQKMQLDAYAYMWKLAQTEPASSVKITDAIDVIDDCSLDEVWYRNKLPGFRVLSAKELPPGATFGMTYKTFVLTPTVLLPWLREKLERSGVRFKRVQVDSLGDLRCMGHEILVNCSGCGARFLADVKDDQMKLVRGQTVLVKTSYDKVFIRRGITDYTYALGRGDGTAILGGIKNWGSADTRIDPGTRADIFRRVNENISDFFSRNPDDYEIVRDIVGIRPQREGDVRLEKEEIGGQKVIHAYGPFGGGYIYSWGLARFAAEMVNELDFAMPVITIPSEGWSDAVKSVL